MARPPVDPAHWLYRFTPEEWLRAAKVELAHALEGLRAREQRKAVASARRAAGMAMNALLVVRPQEAWGRSYVEHLQAVAQDPAQEPTVREAAAQLLQAPAEGPRLIQLGGAVDQAPAIAAATIIDWCEQTLAESPET